MSGDPYSIIKINTNGATYYNPTWTNPYTPYTTGNTTTSNLNYWYSTPIYMYQIKCPKRVCKKMNWLQLDKITPCTKCGAKLKAVSEQADFEIAVG